MQALYDRLNHEEAVRQDAENAAQQDTEAVKRRADAEMALAAYSSDSAVSEAEETTQEQPDLGPGGRKRRERRDPDSGTRGRKRRERKHTDSNLGRRRKKHPVPG